jgi:hypothetical protein
MKLAALVCTHFLSLLDQLNLNNCDFEGRLSDQTRFVISFPTKEIYVDLIPAWVLYQFRIALQIV